jgi:hypothetical protein
LVVLEDMKSGLVVAGRARLELLVLERELDEVSRQDLKPLGLFLNQSFAGTMAVPSAIAAR